MGAKEEFEQMKRDLEDLKRSKPAETEHIHSRSRVNCPECNKHIEVCKNCGGVIPAEKPLFLPSGEEEEDDDEDEEEEEN